MIGIKQFRTSNFEKERLLVEDKDSRKVCIFLSVLMASLFITNSGDIISELMGGGTATE